MNALLHDFLTQSEEQREAAASLAARLELESSDPRVEAGLFGYFHAIKGAAEFLGLTRLEAIARFGERLIEKLRKGEARSEEIAPWAKIAIKRIEFVQRALAAQAGEPPGDDADLRDAFARLSADALAANPDDALAPLGEAGFGAETLPPGRHGESVRVPTLTLERITTSLAELAMARDQLVEAARARADEPIPASLRRLCEVVADIGASVVSARATPIGRLFAGLLDSARLASLAMERPARLLVEGGDTVIEGAHVEILRESLRELILIAIEHCLDAPAERRALGKPEEGRITLTARARRGLVTIEIADDGRGFDAIGDGAALRSVSEKIGELGGEFMLIGGPGRRAKAALTLPIRQPIATTFIVSAGDERYAVFRRDVEETLDLSLVPEGSLICAEGELFLATPEGVLPAVNLRRLLGATDAPTPNPAPGMALKLRFGARVFWLIVEEIVAVRDLAPAPLPSPLQSLSLFAGTAILGDGSVVLVLDRAGLAGELGLPKSDWLGPARAADLEADASLVNAVLFRSRDAALRAAPLRAIERIASFDAADVRHDAEALSIAVDGRWLPLVALPETPWERARPGAAKALILRDGEDRLALWVEEIVDLLEQKPEALRATALERIDPARLFERRRQVRRASDGPKGNRVLFIGPSEFFREIVEVALRENGYEVVAVRESEKAMERLAGDPGLAAVLFSDESSAGRVEAFARQLRALATGSPPALIALTDNRELVGFDAQVDRFDRAGLLKALRDLCPPRSGVAA